MRGASVGAAEQPGTVPGVGTGVRTRAGAGR